MLRTIIGFGLFEWDLQKDRINQRKHGIDFATAAKAFLDPNRIIAKDEKHSVTEERLFCIGKVENWVLTVRYTKRGGRIRIIGAGRWRKETKLYERKKQEKLR